MWEKAEGEYNTHSQGATAVTATPDGQEVIQTGELTTPAYGTQAYDATTGIVDWTKHYSGAGSSEDRATAIAAAPDSASVCITGGSDGGATSEDIATLCYATADGQSLWKARYDSPSSGLDSGADVSFSADGSSVYVSGRAGFKRSGWDFVLLAYAG